MSEKFTIKQILEDHWDSFVIENPNIRSVVLEEVKKVLSCGDTSNGFATYLCPSCGNIKIVPFRCHSRFCNTCGVSYQINRADSIARKLINCKHRHIVFTIAEELRIYFQKDRNLLNILFKTSAQVISEWLYSLNHKENFSSGMVCGLHTFGRDLKWNPHIHMLVSEGAKGSSTEWKHIRFFPYIMLRKKWMTALLANLKDALNPDIFSFSKFQNLISYLYKAYPDGFYVHAPATDFSSPSAVSNYITRYIGRPAMAQSRISNYDGAYVTFWYQRHEDNEIKFETVSAHDFIKKLIIHIPQKSFNMLRYYGLYAKPNSFTSSLTKLSKPHTKALHKITRRWVFRIESSFGYDPTKCKCGDYLNLVSIRFPSSYSHYTLFL